MKTLPAILSAVLLSLLAAAAQAHPVSLWRLDGQENRVYLLGSVHLLRPEDYPLPEVVYEAYEDAEVLIMELDVDDVDPAEAQAVISQLGMIEDGSLSELMGPEAYAEAQAYAERANIPLALLENSEPWLAAITVEQLMLTRIGFNPDFGIESTLATKAAEDGKEILGLETVRQQLELLDGLSLGAQRALLLQSLEESLEIQQLMDDLIHAWRHGDVEFLEGVMLDGIEKHPELYRAVVAERNRGWFARIVELLADSEDYLVVVGALHLIGEDGLPALLDENGYRVVQLREGEPDG